MKTFLPGIVGILWALTSSAPAFAFCGFYVAKADASLYNKASQVVMVRNENRTVISMMNDYEGDLKEFAMVVPVPAVLEKDQIHVGEKVLFDRIDAYSSPRLVEYFDPNPCIMYNREYELSRAAPTAGALSKSADSAERAKALGVSIEAQYTVGEYDILILSAKQSDGLETWLKETGYHLPKGAKSALKPYINQKLKFFVAKVNLQEQAKTGLSYLRPLQFAFESEKFMLPIRLGMLNAKGAQDLLLYVITKNGRVETSNYRTIKLPSGMDIPPYIKTDFAHFYKAMFDEQVKKENMKTPFTEYFWNMGWCDPCSADPLKADELRKLGVFWISPPPSDPQAAAALKQAPTQNGIRPNWPVSPPPIAGGPVQAMVTRLHIRYSAETYPEDLMFTETQDQTNFQGRYVLRQPWTGGRDACEGASHYYDQLKTRQEQEAQTLARLTGWEISEIRKKMGSPAGAGEPDKKWWNNLWK